MASMGRILAFVSVLYFFQKVDGLTCNQANGYQRHPSPCHYVWCIGGNPIVQQCPPGTVFNLGQRSCFQTDTLPANCPDKEPDNPTPPATDNPTGTPSASSPTASPSTEIPPPVTDAPPTPPVTDTRSTLPSSNNPPTLPTTIPETALQDIFRGTAVQVRGDISPTSDNARSEAVCPSGTIVLNCVCTRPGTGCDGTLVAGQNCWAFNALRGPGQQALAVCFYDNSTRWRFVTSQVSLQPEATCPRGFQVTACTLYNRFGHRGYVRPRLDRVRNSCRPNVPCRFGDGCFTQAVCRA